MVMKNDDAGVSNQWLLEGKGTENTTNNQLLLFLHFEEKGAFAFLLWIGPVNIQTI